MIDTKGKLLRRNTRIKSQPRGTGGVREYRIGRSRRLFRITTFCPELVGPGPVHLYLIEDEALILVDTGLPTFLAKHLFYFWRRQRMPDDVRALDDHLSEKEILSGIELSGHRVEDIDFIVITHGHPDHYLMGNRLVGLSGARVAAHVADSAAMSNRWWMLEFWVRRAGAMKAMGMPMPQPGAEGGAGPGLNVDSVPLALNVDLPLGYDGPLNLGGFQTPSMLVVTCPGHSAGSIGILLQRDEGKEAVLLCGDTLLNPITPHPEDLLAYLRTLKRLRSLKNVALTLPAHGDPIPDLGQRVAFLQKHHEHRLRVTYQACRRPTSVWQIATRPRYFETYVDPARFNPLAGQEAFVHVELLQMAGGLRTDRVQGGVHYLVNSGEKFQAVYGRVREIVDDEEGTALRRVW
jgi:glyoxylase-like metal-dependent hydrolase (beta-lactamase superfamily II)